MFLQLILPVIICFLPLIAAVIVFSVVNKLKPVRILLIILLGLAAVVPISIVQFFIPDLTISGISPVMYTIIKCLVLYGLVEEVLKAVALIPVANRKNTLMQNLLYAFIFGLTVGCFESVVYYIEHLQTALLREGQVLYFQIFLRIFTTDIIHMACAGLGGLFIVSCKFKKPKITCLIDAVLIHGFYDFFASFQGEMGWLRYFAIPVILLSLLECRMKYTALQEKTNNCEK